MTTSEMEILRALGFLAEAGGPRRVRTLFVPTTTPESGPAETEEVRLAAPNEGRAVRLCELRARLEHGRYEVAPSDVAENMMSWAICDQVVRLDDR